MTGPEGGGSPRGPSEDAAEESAGPPGEKKFTRDVLWNVASLGVAGVSGIVLNTLIGLIYSDAALGVFNQVFAAYIFFSQIAALGVHHSALQEIAATRDPAERAASATSAVILALVLGSITAFAFAFAAPLVAALMSSDDVGTGMLHAVPALLFFALDKVTLGCINGARRMRWYAVLSGSRFVFMLIAFGVCVALDARPATLPVILSVAEGVTFVLSLFAMRGLLCWLSLAEVWRRARAHLVFGTKGFMSGVLAELNTRIDVLMLGYFFSDSVVGVYSFAAIVAEGLYQLLVVLRSNYAPLCARLFAEGKRRELGAMIRRGRDRTYAVAIPLAAAAIATYLYLVPLIIPGQLVIDSGPFFAVLLTGMALASGYVPFSTILLTSRRPGWHTWLMLGVVSINIVANGLLISTIGPLGAALGTALALVSLVAILLMMSRRVLGLPM